MQIKIRDKACGHLADYAGKTVEVETDFLFDDQFNVGPLPGKKKGVRVMITDVEQIIDDARPSRLFCYYCHGNMPKPEGYEPGDEVPCAKCGHTCRTNEFGHRSTSNEVFKLREGRCAGCAKYAAEEEAKKTVNNYGVTNAAHLKSAEDAIRQKQQELEETRAKYALLPPDLPFKFFHPWKLYGSIGSLSLFAKDMQEIQKYMGIFVPTQMCRVESGSSVSYRPDLDIAFKPGERDDEDLRVVAISDFKFEIGGYMDLDTDFECLWFGKYNDSLFSIKVVFDKAAKYKYARRKLDVKRYPGGEVIEIVRQDDSLLVSPQPMRSYFASHSRKQPKQSNFYWDRSVKFADLKWEKP